MNLEDSTFGDTDSTTTEALATPARVPDEPDIEATIDEIHELLRRGHGDSRIAIGEMIVTRFFHGNVELALSKKPQKETSFSKLLKHERLPLNKSQVSQAVGAYAFLQRASEETSTIFKQLTPSNQSALLPFFKKEPNKAHNLMVAKGTLRYQDFKAAAEQEALALDLLKRREPKEGGKSWVSALKKKFGVLMAIDIPESITDAERQEAIEAVRSAEQQLDGFRQKLVSQSVNNEGVEDDEE